MGGILVLQYILVLFLNAEAQGTVTTIDITKIGRPMEDHVSVCVDVIPSGTDKFMLLPKGNVPVSAESTSAVANCIPFMWDIKGNPGATHFVLNALNKDENLIGQGTEDVTVPEFPALISTVGEGSLPLAKKVLRVKGDKKTFVYTINSEITATYGTTPDITEYYIGYHDETVTSCDSSNDVPICDIPFPGPTITFKNQISVDKAILTYSEDHTRADISIDISGDVSATSPALDIIINLTPSVLCLGSDITGMPCTIPLTPGNSEVDIRLVQTSDGELFDYKQHKITDCEVLAGGIDAETLEVRWLQFGSKIYQLTVSDNTGTPYDDPLVVDCTALTLNHCFAYFIIADAGEYRIKVQEQGKTDSQVQSKLYTMPPPSGSTIQHIFSEVHQNGSEVRTTVCFNHTSQETVEKTFSHYEFVIINYKGQWLKHKLMTHETKGHLCFTPFFVYTNDFDTSKGAKVIVTQRAEDGFTVLASGKTQVTFSENL